jgi:CBS domain-containing protein
MGLLAGSAARATMEKPMYVETILRNKGNTVIVVEPECVISKAAQILHDNRIGAALVRDEANKVIGVISERDIVRGLARYREACLGMTVESLMTSPVVSCAPTDTIDHIMGLMTERRVRHLPVMDHGRLAGIVSIGDVVKERISEIEHESEALKRYIVAG